MAEKVRVVQEIAKIIKEKQVGPPGPAAPANNVFDKISFNRLAGIEVSEGEVAWNLDEDTLDLGQHERVLQLGQELGFFARNGNVGLLPNGTPVMATGSIGASGRIVFDQMNGSDPANAKYFLGLLTEDFDSGEDGHVTSFGKVRQIDTTGALSFGGLETWNEGDVLYVDPVNVGFLTNVSPVAPNLKLAVAFVIHSALNGTLFVRSTDFNENLVSGSSGGGIGRGNILPASPSDGDLFWLDLTTRTTLFTYDETNTEWVPLLGDLNGSSAINFFVDAGLGTDSPEKGLGSGVGSYATLEYAIKQIPKDFINRGAGGINLSVVLNPGAYTIDSQLSYMGFADDTLRFSGGITVIKTVAPFTSKGLGFLTDTTQAWTPDEHKGRFLYCSSSLVLPIIGNTADTIYIPEQVDLNAIGFTTYQIYQTPTVTFALGTDFKTSCNFNTDYIRFIGGAAGFTSLISGFGKNFGLQRTIVETPINRRLLQAKSNETIVLANCWLAGIAGSIGLFDLNFAGSVSLSRSQFETATQHVSTSNLGFGYCSSIVLAETKFLNIGATVNTGVVLLQDSDIENAPVGLKMNLGAKLRPIDNSTFTSCTTDISYGDASFRGALVNRAATQSIIDSTVDQVLFPSEAYDTGLFHDTVTNTERLVVPPGVSKVRVSAYVAWASSAVGARYVRINHSGGGIGDTTERKVAIDNAETNLSTPVMNVSPGDYFQLDVFQSSGGPLNITSAWFAIEVIE